MRAAYQTAYELETDEVLKIMAQPRPKRKAKVCKRQATSILTVMNTALATLTVVAACNGSWQNAFAGAALLLVLMVTGRVVK